MATTSVLIDSTKPCQANKLIKDSTRRCDSMANAINSSSPASRLINCPLSETDISGPQQEMNEHAQHREQESGAQEFRRTEDAHLGRNCFQQREARAGRYQLYAECGQSQRQGGPISRLGNAIGHKQR